MPARFPAEQSFDTVIFLNVLEHLADDAGALRNVYDALEDGGAPWCWFPTARGCSARWTKCSGIAGATRKSSSSKWGQPRVSKWTEC